MSTEKQLASPSYRLALFDRDFLLSDSMRGASASWSNMPMPRRLSRLGASNRPSLS